MKSPLKNIGPGALVAAAFIGPGTVTACTLAGVGYSFTLLWAILLSIIATIVLQEMAARLGLVHGRGLAETVKGQIKNPIFKGIAVLLMLSAILVGNAAYEAGNISGGVLGLQTVFPQTIFTLASLEINYLSLLIGSLGFFLLYIGNYRLIERVLIGLVILMSFSFIITAILTKPDLFEILRGLFVPNISEDNILMVVALVGTTVVPYNLFLHASLVREKWNGIGHLAAARRDLYISIILGGFVSMTIVIAAAAIQSDQLENAADMAKSFEPLFGKFSTYFLSIGLFAAGITSAITAPLAAAYVAKGCFGWNDGFRSKRFRGIWMLVLGLGVLFSSIGMNPIALIQFAQVANGLLLPIIAAFLLWVVNRKQVLGTYQNSRTQNVFGLLVLVAAFILGARTLLKVFGFL